MDTSILAFLRRMLGDVLNDDLLKLRMLNLPHTDDAIKINTV